MCTHACFSAAFVLVVSIGSPEEAARGDELEAELGRVRITVKGRVQALKAALEEAENDAEL